MGRLSLAWRVLTSGDFAARLVRLLEAPPALPGSANEAVSSVAGSSLSAPSVISPSARPANPSKPVRNDAISLLAALQREGRLIDFLKESIDGYSDAQIGAAVRDIHRDCGQVLERQFAIRPVLDQPEGSSVPVGTQRGAGMIKLSGKVGETSAASGVLVHHGWQATRCEVPVWTGDSEAALVVAPAEVEVR